MTMLTNDMKSFFFPHPSGGGFRAAAFSKRMHAVGAPILTCGARTYSSSPCLQMLGSLPSYFIHSTRHTTQLNVILITLYLPPQLILCRLTLPATLP